MSNVVLMFSATDEKTPYEQEELVAARSIVHKVLKRSPAWTVLERIFLGLL